MCLAGHPRCSHCSHPQNFVQLQWGTIFRSHHWTEPFCTQLAMQMCAKPTFGRNGKTCADLEQHLPCGRAPVQRGLWPAPQTCTRHVRARCATTILGANCCELQCRFVKSFRRLVPKRFNDRNLIFAPFQIGTASWPPFETSIAHRF